MSSSATLAPATPATTATPAGLFGEKYQKATNLNPCVFCGCNIKDGRGFSIHAVEGGSSLLRADLEALPADLDPAGDCGWYPVGSSCTRLVPAAYRGPAL